MNSIIERDIEAELHQLLGEYPVVTVLGPRQAGKTTLVSHALGDYEYCNLESPEIRQYALDDPKAFLSQFQGNVILDEIQRAPDLLSYIQVIVDSQGRNGQFVLTGSHQLALHEAITQSLAGRVGILTLLPLNISELVSAGIGFDSFSEYIYRGFLPRVHDQQQRPTQAYGNYYQTYIERDVRQLVNLRDLSLFDKFIKLLAGRVGQLMDYTALANDVGVSANTIKQWLSILEASFVVHKLSPYYENFGKRVIKSPKYYFLDTGLLTFLLGIEQASQVARDPLVGQLFENLVIIECLKIRANQGKLPNLWFYRDSNGSEVDLLFQDGRELLAVEIKSSSTWHPSQLKGLRKMAVLIPAVKHGFLIYSGERMEFSDSMTALGYKQIGEVFQPIS